MWSAATGSDGSDRGLQTSKHLVHNINCSVLKKGILFVAVEQFSQIGKGHVKTNCVSWFKKCKL